MMKDTFKIAKSMKRPIIHVNTNYMLGSDEEFCTLSLIEIESDIPRPFTVKTNGILDSFGVVKLSQKSPVLLYTECSRLDDEYYIHTWDEEIYYSRIMDLFRKVSYLLQSSPLVFHKDNLETDPEFMTSVAKLKVSDGLNSYAIDNQFLVTSFNKVHAINSSDKISINIYDIDPVSYLYEFIIDKKKYIVKEYIRYRKMFI